MRDVKDQLREYWPAVLADYPAPDAEAISVRTDVTVEELVSPNGDPIPVELGRMVGQSASWRFAAAAAVVVLLVVGGVAWLLGSSTGSDVIGPPDQPSTTVATPSTAPPTTVPASQPETPAQTTGAPINDLSWQELGLEEIVNAPEAAAGARLYDGGDRLVLVHHSLDTGDIEAISTSSDGLRWVTRPVEPALRSADVVGVWEGSVLSVSGGGGWGRGERDDLLAGDPTLLSILHSDGSVDHREFPGDIRSAAIGPSGIVVVMAPHWGPIIEEELGQEFLGVLETHDLRAGILYLETVDGQTAEIDVSDGGWESFLSARLPSVGSPLVAWYSKSGRDWSPQLELPPDVDVFGTRDGFVGLAGPPSTRSEVWHSPDGQTWRSLGSIPFRPNGWERTNLLPVRWKDGAIATDGVRLAYISADGIVPITAPQSVSTADQTFYMAGDLGLVIANVDAFELHVTTDGVNWVTTELPRDMTYTPSWYTSGTTGAVTDRAVLLPLWVDVSDGSQPRWWLATLP